MKLDLNNSGSWKRIMDFSVSMESFVKEAAPRLVMASSHKPTLRILDDFGNVASFWTHCDGWHDAREARRVP